MTTLATPAGSTPGTTSGNSRPRVEGEREGEIYGAVIELLIQTGYDKLTFDAVATSARAGKATLYRRWPSKADLVLDALTSSDLSSTDEIDTGTLRGDLLAQSCAAGGLCDKSPALLGALVPALHRDPELFAAFKDRIVQPRLQAAMDMFARARDRGEVGRHADLATLATVLPAVCIHETVILGSPTTPARVAEIVDTVILPACRASLTAAAGA